MLRIIVANGHYEHEIFLTLVFAYVYVCYIFAGACCDKLDAICLLNNKQNDKHNIGDTVQIFKIVF